MFGVDEISLSLTLHVGRSHDGIAWQIDPDPLVMRSDDAEVSVTAQSYDPGLTRIGETYHLTWCKPARPDRRSDW
ncbi:MAG: hypothetical protein ABSA08_02430 [Acidimicrobiales bacterium]